MFDYIKGGVFMGIAVAIPAVVGAIAGYAITGVAYDDGYRRGKEAGKLKVCVDVLEDTLEKKETED